MLPVSSGTITKYLPIPRFPDYEFSIDCIAGITKCNCKRMTAGSGSCDSMSTFSIFVSIFGIFCVIKYYRGGNFCPKCNHTPMLNLDNPEAINLIKKYDLKVGENPSSNTQNKSSSESLETPK